MDFIFADDHAGAVAARCACAFPVWWFDALRSRLVLVLVDVVGLLHGIVVRRFSRFGSLCSRLYCFA